MFGRKKPVKIVTVKGGYKSAHQKTEKQAKKMAKKGYELRSTAKRGLLRNKREAVYVRKD